MDTINTNTTTVNTTPGRPHYRAPGWATRRVFNPMMGGLVKVGLSVKGAAVLSVRGRTTGEWHSTPVNPLTFDGEQYLVAPRGETQWVRNLRVAGSGTLRRGRRDESFAAVEIGDDEKIAILRAYLKEWAWEVGQFFDGVDADATDAELAAIAPRHPIFRVT